MSEANDVAALPCPFCGLEARSYRYNGTIQATCSQAFNACAGSDVSAPVEMWNRRVIVKRQRSLPALVIE